MHGVHVSLITPFTAAGAVDAASLARLAGHVLDHGAAGLVALATTGEAALLSAAEQRTVLEVCRAVTIDRGVPLTVGAGTMGTDDTVRQARERAPMADALLVVVPYYLRPSDEGVVEHFQAVGAAVDVPLLPYNIPYRTGKQLHLDTLLRLLDLDCVTSMKHCPGAIDADTLALLASGRPVLCGDDAYTYPMLRLGAAGAISATACLAPAACAGLDLATHNALLPLVDALFAEPSPAVLKACLAELGLIDDPAVRAPLRAPRRETVRRAMAAYRALYAEVDACAAARAACGIAATTRSSAASSCAADRNHTS
ncbi:dihydrodipicolinate synthase family protein [Actinomadura macrotermitis]|uniref:4-hydroxy-tetrahydrodipicolinate synthase n=1 Tax=Actinomadura macrotermitis TaxID=2585200 RepID=A0A7K0BXV1_9ACTN|nr:dihydrodipicolinate synthase family protein [Actinomadura macrotermitis]MQY06018.1 4-hydroxy-tetrahydrodipicolinate synthase [Actinomadura macrotermitis]